MAKVLILAGDAAEDLETMHAALVIPGGRAPEFIRVDPELGRIAEHFFVAQKPIGTPSR